MKRKMVDIRKILSTVSFLFSTDLFLLCQAGGAAINKTEALTLGSQLPRGQLMVLWLRLSVTGAVRGKRRGSGSQQGIKKEGFLEEVVSQPGPER